MSEQRVDAALPGREQHRGGFRPMIEMIRAQTDDLALARGGPHYGEFIEQVRTLMDHTRLAAPSDELTLKAIEVLRELNAELGPAVGDEWSAPSWTRADLPARGNIAMPPFTVDRMDNDSVEARLTFRTFHLGGNAAAHGGQIATIFDDLLGMAAAMHAGSVTRTASLTVDYRSITPLDTELLVRSWTERREGRKVYVRATLHDGERLCAEASGLFIVLKPGQQ